MDTIRVAWGSATGPTATSSFDAALADANVHNYNLVELSSVVPAGATVEAVGTAPDLGPTGDALFCVLARQTLTPANGAPDSEAPGADDVACAGLGWARTDAGHGLFYEASGLDPATVRHAVETGLDHGMAIRDWRRADGDDDCGGDGDVVLETEPAHPDDYASAVVVACYGESESLLAPDGPAVPGGG